MLTKALILMPMPALMRVQTRRKEQMLKRVPKRALKRARKGKVVRRV